MRGFLPHPSRRFPFLSRELVLFMIAFHRGNRRNHVVRGLVFAALVSIFALAISPAAAQIGRVDPLIGASLELPNGTVRHGSRPTVWVREHTGKLTTGQVFVEVGGTSIVLMPDGQLYTVASRDVRPANLSYVGFTVKEITDRMLANERYKGFQAESSLRYVYIYKCSDRFLKAASTILETTFAGVYDYLKRRGFDVHEPKTPLVAVIFDTQEEFLKESKLPEEVLAYYDPRSNHIYLWEQPKAGTTAVNLVATQQTSTISHEGVHQILHNVGLQERLSRWPAWISEGLPEYFSASIDLHSLRWRGAGYTNHLRLLSIQGDLRSGTPVGLVETIVKSPGLSSKGYAWSWALTHYLATNRNSTFIQYLEEVGKRKPLENGRLSISAGDSQADLDEFRKYFGDSLDDLSNRVLTHVSKLKVEDPTERDKHFIVALEFVRNSKIARDFAIGLSAEQAQEQRAGLLKKLSVAELRTAQIKFYEFKNRKDAIYFCRSWINGAGKQVLER